MTHRPLPPVHNDRHPQGSSEAPAAGPRLEPRGTPGRTLQLLIGEPMTWREKVLAAVAAATLFLTGMNALVQAVNTATDYGCKQGWWRDGCPPLPPTRP